MQLNLGKVWSFSEKGMRKNNEDHVFPAPAENGSDRQPSVFIVCDGVGGAAKGEEASQIVSQSMAAHLQTLSKISEEEVSQAIIEAEQGIDAYLEDNPQAEGMATTVSGVAFHRSGATVINMGDSRVYQIRNGAILFRTVDHSLVGEMLENKLISEEEARTHPNRNVVTRALMGSKNPSQADVTHIQDIQPDDYFFLCTDGVWEVITDQHLGSILGEKESSDEFKMNAIRELCAAKSRDNYSAILVPITGRTDSSSGDILEIGKHIIQTLVRKASGFIQPDHSPNDRQEIS